MDQSGLMEDYLIRQFVEKEKLKNELLIKRIKNLETAVKTQSFPLNKQNSSLNSFSRTIQENRELKL